MSSVCGAAAPDCTALTDTAPGLGPSPSVRDCTSLHLAGWGRLLPMMWWVLVESNHGPPAYKTGALTAELRAYFQTYSLVRANSGRSAHARP